MPRDRILTRVPPANAIWVNRLRRPSGPLRREKKTASGSLGIDSCALLSLEWGCGSLLFAASTKGLAAMASSGQNGERHPTVLMRSRDHVLEMKRGQPFQTLLAPNICFRGSAKRRNGYHHVMERGPHILPKEAVLSPTSLMRKYQLESSVFESSSPSLNTYGPP